MASRHRWGGRFRVPSFAAAVLLLLTGCGSNTITIQTPIRTEESSQVMDIVLPEPRLKGAVSLEEALQKRRSVREYSNEPLDITEITQLLWAAQGVTSEWGGRTAPSAGATYPLEIYVVAGNVNGLKLGVYHYIPSVHRLSGIREGDIRRELSEAALNQSWVASAPVSIVIAAVYERTTQRYGDRGIIYVHMEVGHAAQNVCLQAVALGLGAVPVGAFEDEKVKGIIRMTGKEAPLYIIPVGKTITN